jgi:hypothetical protein
LKNLKESLSKLRKNSTWGIDKDNKCPLIELKIQYNRIILSFSKILKDRKKNPKLSAKINCNNSKTMEISSKLGQLKATLVRIFHTEMTSIKPAS